MIDTQDFFSTTFMPLTMLLGNWFYFVVWGLFTSLVYMKAQNPILPGLSSLGIGAIMAGIFPEESVNIMIAMIVFMLAPTLVFIFKGEI